MVVVDISEVLGRWPLLGGAHSSWSWLTSLMFSVDGHFSVVVVDISEPIRHGPSRFRHISEVLGRRPLLGGAHSSWSWLTSLKFSVDGHF